MKGMIKYMIKDYERDEIIRIFRKFARLGLEREGLNPLRVCKIIDVCCMSKKTKLDMMAVSDTLRLLELEGEGEIASAVRAIYFSTASHRLAKNEISRRVCRYAVENYCDERTVYRRLTKARRLYQKVREGEGTLWD